MKRNMTAKVTDRVSLVGLSGGESLSADAGDMGSIPDPRGSRMPQNN